MPKIGHRSAKTQQQFPKSHTIVRNRTLGAKIGHQSQKSDTSVRNCTLMSIKGH